MSLFRNGNYKLHSGAASSWKIDCDHLTDEDWKTLAIIASEILRPFGSVVGVPSGGLKFAEALKKFITVGPLLVVDDVLTTGASMQDYRSEGSSGVVVFARSKCPWWVTPIFQMR